MKTTGLFFILILAACSPKEANQINSHSHTSKLQKNISVSFTNIDELDFKVPDDSTDASLTIFAVKSDKQKLLIVKQPISSEGHINITLPDDLERFEYLIGLIEAVDSYGNKISNVTNYKIGEQESIDAAKERLKNRN